MGFASLALGKMMCGLGRLDEAEAAFLQADAARRIARIPPDAAIFVELTDVYLELERFDEALRYGLAAERALERHAIGLGFIPSLSADSAC